MLTDTALKNLKPQEAMYKVADRDGMYVTVSPAEPSLFATTTGSTAAGNAHNRALRAKWHFPGQGAGTLHRGSPRGFRGGVSLAGETATEASRG